MPELRDVLEKAAAGRRLSEEEGTALLESADLLDVGRAADLARRRRHPEGRVTFVIDRNINYTNVCVSACRFCAFYRSPDAPDAYVLSVEEIIEKIGELVRLGGTQVLIQGGLHPELGLEYYIGMLEAVKARFDGLQVHSFSPPEIVHLARREGLSVRTLLAALRAAGLDSVPGGGAEILVDRVRRLISPRKISWREWMDVMYAAHELGMRTTATMMFGTVETPAERVRHLVRLREAQDRTGGFTAFIPWSYQPPNTELGGEAAGSHEYLKVLAVSRLMLDNFPNVQASWVTQGPKVAQVALSFGANDFGGTMLEENVVRAAGAAHCVPLAEIIRMIRDAGFVPAQRTTEYRILREF
ncbi:cyclic dehypoxanthinyl futalosine synthase [Candidatus Desulforudis audaxviator]|uniref:Cyclic dehypoxanthine futalosine synthase n=1 Tax=Desulforudis audaxviator (strain MP104C) TaxID=477974 RepID=B1I3P3_DESAP|nr:cyclic dehypoxanthinyl futalosine synthase [Candidatus Desulforudis audaxviator]ACA59603.1 Radical SAM domain protein [Candidatus Desulforudis audaxviator MP104C]AZK59590.1 Menaquinone via futalosine step 3 protein [Candidatus Desulforudis audaxviator]